MERRRKQDPTGESLRENCPNAEFLLARIYPYSVRIQGNKEQKKLRVWARFT